MNHIGILSKLFLVVGTFTIVQSTVMAQSYRMICRGGKNMFARTQAYSLSGDMGEWAMVTFKKGKTAAKPGKGECVWLIRPMFEEEPDKLEYYSPTDGQTQIYFVNRLGTYLGQGPLWYLLYSIRNSEIFHLEAERSGGRFIVTKLGN